MFLVMVSFLATVAMQVDGFPQAETTPGKVGWSHLGLSTTPTTSNHTTLPKPERGNATMKVFNYTEISKMYAIIMKTYDKKFRPFYSGKVTKCCTTVVEIRKNCVIGENENSSKKPLDIQLDMHVLSFGDINEVEMEYSIDMYFAQIWQDPRLSIQGASNDSIIELIGSQVESMWLPDTIFINSKRSKFHTVTVDNRFLTIFLKEGMIVYHARITLSASCRMNLRRYPFDTQRCHLAIESYGHDTTDLRYHWRKDEECHENCNDILVYDREMANFDLLLAKKSDQKTAYHAARFSSTSASFVFKRRTQFFIIRAYIPCILIVMVSWSTFWISKDAVPARAAICITTILTLITMLGVANVNMPRVSYIKALDLYLLVSFIFVFCALLEYITLLNTEGIPFAPKKKRRLKSRKNSRVELFGMENQSKNCVVLVGSNEDSTERDAKFPYRSQNGCSCSERTKRRATLVVDRDMKSQRDSLDDGSRYPKLNETHIIDTFSRVFFPAGYGLFNAFYWWSCLN